MDLTHIHYLAGGGLGDVYREAFFNNALGILRRWKILNPRERLRVLLMSHNPAARELLEGQSWIDDLVQVSFPIGGDWHLAYERNTEMFEGLTELRFHLDGNATLYHPRFDELRRAIGPVEHIPAIGMSCDVGAIRSVLHASVIVHGTASEAERHFSAELYHALWHELPASSHFVGPQPHLNARELVGAIRNAKCVVASESSVYYIAAMNGVPVCMFYNADQTFERTKTGKSDWHWFFGEDDPRNLFLKTPISEDDLRRFREWLHQRLSE